MAPEWGSAAKDLPPETQFLLLQLSPSGPYAIILPLIDSGRFRATLRPPRCESHAAVWVLTMRSSSPHRVRLIALDHHAGRARTAASWRRSVLRAGMPAWLPPDGTMCCWWRQAPIPMTWWMQRCQPQQRYLVGVRCINPVLRQYGSDILRSEVSLRQRRALQPSLLALSASPCCPGQVGPKLGQPSSCPSSCSLLAGAHGTRSTAGYLQRVRVLEGAGC